MITDAKIISYNDNGELTWVRVNLEDIGVNKNCAIAIDGSTTGTGCSIVELDTGNLVSSILFSRDKKSGESKVRYKVELKRALYKLLINNRKFISYVFYEEPFIQYAGAASALLMLRTSVEELIVENEPELDHIKYGEVNNKKWKKEWLDPEPCPTGSELEKEAVRKKMVQAIPLMAEVSQDEIDSAAMGFVVVRKIGLGEEDDLKSKKKRRPFQYNVEFIGADKEDDMLQEFSDSLDEFKIPKRVLENGIRIQRINGYGKFDNKVYEAMADDDLLLILEYNSKHHGNMTLKHRIGHLTAEYENIYAIIWRKSRKYK